MCGSTCSGCSCVKSEEEVVSESKIFEFDEGVAELIAKHGDVSIGHVTNFLNNPVKPGVGYVIHGEGDEVSKKLIFSTDAFSGIEESDLVSILQHRVNAISAYPQDKEILEHLNEVQELLYERAECERQNEAILTSQHHEWTALPNGVVV